MAAGAFLSFFVLSSSSGGGDEMERNFRARVVAGLIRKRACVLDKNVFVSENFPSGGTGRAM